MLLHGRRTSLPYRVESTFKLLSNILLKLLIHSSCLLDGSIPCWQTRDVEKNGLHYAQSCSTHKASWISPPSKLSSNVLFHRLRNHFVQDCPPKGKPSMSNEGLRGLMFCLQTDQEVSLVLDSAHPMRSIPRNCSVRPMWHQGTSRGLRADA